MHVDAEPVAWIQSLATGGLMASILSVLRPIMSLFVFVLIFAAVMFFLKQLKSVSGGGDNKAGEGDDGGNTRADQMRLFAALAAQTRHIGVDEPMPERAFLMVSKADCPSCAMLYTEFATLDRLLPFLTHPGKGVPVLRLPFEEHMQTVRDMGIEAVPSFIFKDGTQYHECQDLSVEEWVLFLRQRVPDIFAHSAVQNAAEADSDVRLRRTEESPTSASVRTMEPPSPVIEELDDSSDEGEESPSSQAASESASENDDNDEGDDESRVGDSPSSS